MLTLGSPPGEKSSPRSCLLHPRQNRTTPLPPQRERTAPNPTRGPQAVSISREAGSSRSAHNVPEAQPRPKPRASKPTSLTLVINEKRGYKVVGQGSVVVGLHTGQAGPGVGDVLLHRCLAHGRMQLPIDFPDLKQKERWERGAWHRGAHAPRAQKKSPFFCGAALLEAAPESGSSSKGASFFRCHS